MKKQQQQALQGENANGEETNSEEAGDAARQLLENLLARHRNQPKAPPREVEPAMKMVR